MKNLFNSLEKLKKGLIKTKNNIVGKLTELFSGKSTIDENLFEEIREILYQADIGFEVTETIIEKIKNEYKFNSQLT
ncbi:MAG: signal recognition particle receptor subunit alpha, partial [bacterium]|nr:signal recognition particle receptor subunit alpha [bacterium]